MQFFRLSATNEFFNRIIDWVEANTQKLIAILITLLVCWVVSKITEKTLRRVLSQAIRNNAYQTPKDREKRINTLVRLTSAIVRFLVWVTGLIVIIGILGLNAAPLLASAGAIGIAFGLGAQKLINDLVSGVFIISENQYRIGDYVDLDGVAGTVKEITIRTTVLEDLNGAIHYVPNGSIVVATNSSQGVGQINLDILVDADTDLNKLQEIIDQVGSEIAQDKVHKTEIIEPLHFIRVTDYTGTGISVKVMGKTTSGKQLEIKGLFFTRLKKLLDQNEIKLAAVLPAATTTNRKK